MSYNTSTKEYKQKLADDNHWFNNIGISKIIVPISLYSKIKNCNVRYFIVYLSIRTVI